MNLLQCIISLVPIGLFVVALPLASRRGWLRIRTIACGFTAATALMVLVWWVSTKDDMVGLLGLTSSLIVGLMILSWPITAPRMMRRLGLRW